MKKVLTIALSVLFSGSLFAQTELRKIEAEANVKEGGNTQTLINNNGGPVNSGSNKNEDLDFTRIGVTIYDLQTNASMQRRIILHEDGKLTAVWTTSPDPSPWQQRGTGYNHFDGTSWMDPVSRNLRIEGNVRTGWPNIGVISTDNGDIEYVIAHNAQASGTSDGGLQFSRNTAIGDETAWNTVEILTSSPNSPSAGPIWSRTATSGNYIYIIANYFDDNNVTIDGIRNPTVYSRYNIEADTFMQNSVLLPGYNSDNYGFGNGDTYSIDAKDSIVAIVIGGRFTDITLWKSYDYGDTFERIVIDTLFNEAFEASNPDHLIEDWMLRNDGSMHVALDENGNAHIFWGSACVANPDPDDLIAFSRGQETKVNGELINCFGIQYRNDINLSGNDSEYVFAPVKLIASMLDRNNDGLITLADEIAGETKVKSPSVTVYPHVSSSGVVSMPTVAIDADGNIFVVYSAILEHALTIDYEHYRDVYVVYSTDNGENWSEPQNITDDPENEQIFPSVAQITDDFIHIVFQEMDEPGTSVQNGKDQSLRDIYYVAVPIDMILNDELGPGQAGTYYSIDKINNLNSIKKVYNYPNPFSEKTDIVFQLEEKGNVEFTVVNLLGKVVYHEEYSNLTPANYQISFDGSMLNEGIYIYSLNSGNYKMNANMMISR